ncbi:SDR family oxidoreductase [Candidatus Hecatella orcuttiae]|jgi:NAD(P)-dependent dehydrogenase (short-subunit alcohol dehydrogenase family)|uniref:SDR family NAD(P)-dependent oxidoreductase n=1 Tax=Candidatus Hecatella orcuttiae TaxID=1935119 RepID=UPI0028680547|nr:SDR family oxidoreductase [Candidatus Hecatella orcuttiae]
MKLKGKVAIVTGASSGIGRAIALTFAQEGAKVVVSDINRKGGEETVQLISKAEGEATFVEADVSKSSDVKKLVDTCIEKYGRVDILVNNAGVGIAGSVLDTSEEAWDKCLDVNLKGVFLCSKQALPDMVKHGGGVIINIGSIAGLRGGAQYSAYCASKAGVIDLSQCMAIDYAKYNIRVNCICPGQVETPMLMESVPEELLQKLIKANPMRRFGKPEEIAKLAVYLASDDSTYMTGAILVIDGGITLGYGPFAGGETG